LSYSEFVDCYAYESTYGSNAPNLNAAGDTGYLLGAISIESHLPVPTTTIHYLSTAVNAKEVADGALFKGKFLLSGMYGMRAQNGIPIRMAMGKDTTTGPVGSVYTHTLVPYTDGSLLPSMTFQHERTGGGTDWATQITGVKINRLFLVHDFQNADFLMYRADVVGAQAADPGFTLTTKPALPATANSDEYKQLTRTFNSVSIEGLTYVELSIDNGLIPVHDHSYSGGSYTGRWPKYYREGQRKHYSLKLQFHPHTIEDDIWDEILETDTANAKTVVLKWARHATDDYIEVTMTDCEVVQYPMKTPVAGNLLVDECIIEPRAISIVVKDGISGGAYGS
jgi:hypothetical protein